MLIFVLGLYQVEPLSVIVTCQADVIKHMLQQPILSGRIEMWAYALVEYDLGYEFLRVVKGQIVTDFITEHRITCCSLMARLVIMVKRLVLFLFLQVALFLNSQTDWKKNARIIKLNMMYFYLA